MIIFGASLRLVIQIPIRYSRYLIRSIGYRFRMEFPVYPESVRALALDKQYFTLDMWLPGRYSHRRKPIDTPTDMAESIQAIFADGNGFLLYRTDTAPLLSIER